MKTIKYLVLIALFIGFTSCNDDNDDLPGDNPKETKTKVSGDIENFYAPQVGGHGAPISGEFTKFDFETGKMTISEIDWDIAFRGSTIIVNGGVSSGTTDEPVRNGNAATYIAKGTLDEITSVDISKFVQDASTGLAIPSSKGKGWYNYTGEPDHLIQPIPGNILVFKTRDGKYAKVEILSYYKDGDSSKRENARYYTFNFIYQSKNDVTTF